MNGLVAAFVVVVAMITGWLATRRARESNRIAAFEHRLAVFNLVHEVLSDVMSSGKTDYPDIRKLARAYQDAQFLFPQAIILYIDSIHQRCVKLAMYSKQAKSRDAKVQNKALDLEHAMLLEVVGELSRLHATFRPHMSLADWDAVESIDQAAARFKAMQDRMKDFVADNRAQQDV